MVTDTTEREAFEAWYIANAFKCGDRRGWEGVGWGAWQARAALSTPPASADDWQARALAAEAKLAKSRTDADDLRRALEIIAVGDATNPVLQAAEELIALGHWRDIPEAKLAAQAAAVPAGMVLVPLEPTRFSAPTTQQPQPPQGAEPSRDAERLAEALHAAVSAIYFDDGSKFKSALGRVVYCLDQGLAGRLLCDPKRAYDESTARYDAAQAQGEKGAGCE